MSKSTRLRSKKPLKEIILTVRAADSAPIPRSTTCNVKISDANSLNKQKFNLSKKYFINLLTKIIFRNSIYLNIYDNAEIGTVISSINSNYTNEECLIIYTFKEPCDILDLNLFNGKIKLGKNLPIIQNEIHKNCTILVNAINEIDISIRVSDFYIFLKRNFLVNTNIK